MRGSTQSASVSVIQSRAQPSYARTKPGRKVLRRESPITIFAELADQLAEVRRHIWLYAKEGPARDCALQLGQNMQALTNATMATTDSTIELFLRQFPRWSCRCVNVVPSN